MVAASWNVKAVVARLVHELADLLGRQLHRDCRFPSAGFHNR
jgi:hypothetical protein